tara:strand:+ start:4708 stop:6048 length:1341 start_codon:yes stop_codon:yes gene_type:complete
MIKKDKNIFDKCLGLVLLSGKVEQSNFLHLLDPKWFNSSFHSDVYNAMIDLVGNEYIDIINITQHLRSENKLKDGYLYKIADLSNDVYASDLMNSKGVLNECYYIYSVREVAVMVQNINKELLSASPNSSTILKEIDRGKEVLIMDHTTKDEGNKSSIDKVLEQHKNAKLGISVGLELGWNGLKRYIVLESDDVMVVGGRPAMGKTAWAISLIRNVVFNQGKSMIFFSLEMSKERIVRRILSLMLNIDSNKIKFGECSDLEISKINELKEDPIWKKLHILDGSHSVKHIQSEVLKLTGSSEIDVIVIDYLQKIMPEKNDNRYQEVTKISNGIKRLVMSVRVPCIALAQLSRDSAKSGKRPSLPDLKESGEIEQDASIVAFLHRPEYYGQMTDNTGASTEGLGEFITAKNRDGAIGISDMKIDLATSNWSDYDKDDNNFPISQFDEF